MRYRYQFIRVLTSSSSKLSLVLKRAQELLPAKWTSKFSSSAIRLNLAHHNHPFPVFFSFITSVMSSFLNKQILQDIKRNAVHRELLYYMLQFPYTDVELKWSKWYDKLTFLHFEAEWQLVRVKTSQSPSQYPWLWNLLFCGVQLSHG